MQRRIRGLAVYMVSLTGNDDQLAPVMQDAQDLLAAVFEVCGDALRRATDTTHARVLWRDRIRAQHVELTGIYATQLAAAKGNKRAALDACMGIMCGEADRCWPEKLRDIPSVSALRHRVSSLGVPMVAETRAKRLLASLDTLRELDVRYRAELEICSQLEDWGVALADVKFFLPETNLLRRDDLRDAGEVIWLAAGCAPRPRTISRWTSDDEQVEIRETRHKWRIARVWKPWYIHGDTLTMPPGLYPVSKLIVGAVTRTNRVFLFSRPYRVR
jgi:hypothetical protein